jgi:crotonobetainyl-CoA:carnitine CoA-transferase CaiB-like acyl-CoA transferase
MSDAAPARRVPFEGVRVLDLTRVLASPFASYLLALLGAEVLKIEDPKGGDVMRTRAAGDPKLGAIGMGTGFLSQNGNKRSVTLNLRAPEGQAVFRELAAQSDVIVENLRTGTMARYGLGYEDLRAINPRLIYCSLTGYGHTGEKKRHPAYDPVIQAASGVMGLTALGDSGPVKAGIPAIDYGTGMMAAFGVVSALYERQVSGLGQHVDVSMFDTALALMSSVVTDVMTRGVDPKPIGNTLGPIYGTNRTYRAADAMIWISAPEEHHQAGLWRVLGREDLPADPRFATEALRARNVLDLTAEIEKTLARRPADEWERELNEVGVPAMRVRTVREALALPQLASRDFFHSFDDIPGWDGTAIVPMLPFRLSETPARLERRAPLLGEHTDEILGDLGKSPEQIAALRQAGAI